MLLIDHQNKIKNQNHSQTASCRDQTQQILTYSKKIKLKNGPSEGIQLEV